MLMYCWFVQWKKSHHFTEQVMYRNICICLYILYIHMIYIMQYQLGGNKGHMNLKENGEGCMGGFGGKKGKGDCN